jgi:hypothetical protein
MTRSTILLTNSTAFSIGIGIAYSCRMGQCRGAIDRGEDLECESDRMAIDRGWNLVAIDQHPIVETWFRDALVGILEKSGDLEGEKVLLCEAVLARIQRSRSDEASRVEPSVSKAFAARAERLSAGAFEGGRATPVTSTRGRSIDMRPLHSHQRCASTKKRSGSGRGHIGFNSSHGNAQIVRLSYAQCRSACRCRLRHVGSPGSQ